MVKLTVGALVALAAIVSGQDAVARCGPWYSNQACPFNANGLGGELYCTKFGFCSSSASDGSSTGIFVQMDGNCVDQSDMNAYCNNQLAGATCSYAEKRCQISILDAKKFNGISGSSTTTTTTTGSGTTTTTSGSISDAAPTTTSSSATTYPLMIFLTIVAMIVAAVNM